MTQLYLRRQDYMVVDPKDISRKSDRNLLQSIDKLQMLVYYDLR